MRPWCFQVVPVAIAACLLSCTKPTPSPLVLDVQAVAAWGEDDPNDSTQRDGGSSAWDGMYQGPPVLMRNGRPIGFLRFVHVAAGLGRVRFVADSMPGYESDHVEAVVEEGTSSGYLQAINVTHRVRIVHVESDGDAGASADLVAPMTTDVYNNAGCTVALGGVAVWRRSARTQDAEVRRLIRIVDIPRRQSGIGMMRLMVGIAGSPTVTVREAAQTLYADLPYLMITGMRRIDPGPHELSFVSGDAGTAPFVSMSLPAGEVHTLWVFAEHPRTHRPVRMLLTNDVPPERIGPDFIGEMPVYR